MTAGMEVILNFERRQLLYDIANYAYVEAHSCESRGEAPESVHLVCDVLAPGNADRVARVLALAHAAVVEMLYPMTRRRAAAAAIADHLWTPDRYSVTLRSAGALSEGAAHLLSSLIHEYLVGRALSDWLAVSLPSAAARWQERTATVACDIRDCALGSLAAVSTRKCAPF